MVYKFSKRIFFIIIIISLVFLLYLIYQSHYNSQPNRNINAIECSNDDDCEIFYSKCSCEAIPTNHSLRNSSETSNYNFHLCFANQCLKKNIYARCFIGICMRSDAQIKSESGKTLTINSLK